MIADSLSNAKLYLWLIKKKKKKGSGKPGVANARFGEEEKKKRGGAGSGLALGVGFSQKGKKKKRRRGKGEALVGAFSIKGRGKEEGGRGVRSRGSDVCLELISRAAAKKRKKEGRGGRNSRLDFSMWVDLQIHSTQGKKKGGRGGGKEALRCQGRRDSWGMRRNVIVVAKRKGGKKRMAADSNSRTQKGKEKGEASHIPSHYSPERKKKKGEKNRL